jgi:ATP-dependent Clp protease protease subunit
MIHQVLGGAKGQATEVEITVNFILKLKERLNGILAHHTGKTLEQITRDTDRDHYMNAEEALAYGIVDQVHGKQP